MLFTVLHIAWLWLVAGAAGLVGYYIGQAETAEREETE